MAAVNIATGIIDKLQEENRILLETLHKAQDNTKYLEKQLAEKDRLIKVLEERVRAGTDGILEMASRQKDLTIKHLEAQIQKLLKENEDLEIRIEAIQAEICPKCESKLLLKENVEKRSVSKSFKASGKLGSTFHGKKSSETVCPNRLKVLEKIIEHKDSRIMNLSKEVKRLSKIEEELTLKIRRLTKLLPMSRLPPEAITDCLLQEIQLLESQTGVNDSYKKSVSDVLNKYKKDVGSKSQVSLNKSSKSSERYKLSSAPNVRYSAANLYQSNQGASDVNRTENEALLKKLQKLYDDINELKRLFAHESDKLSYGLNTTASEYHSFKTQLEELIDNLNDIVQKILSNDFRASKESISKDLSPKSDDSFVISCLQDRLKQSLEMVSEYENEIKALREDLQKVKAQKSHEQIPLNYYKRTEDKITESFSDATDLSNVNDIKKLHEIIKSKDDKLQAAERHIVNCQKFIEELQNSTKFMNFDISKRQYSPSIIDLTTTAKTEQQNKFLQTKLDVAEKNINTCENIIEKLQNTVKILEEENVKLESELVQVKSKAISAENTTICSAISETHVSNLKKLNKELQDKVKSLEEVNKKLSETKNVPTKNIEDEKTLLKKLDASEKQISSLEKSIETLQSQLKTAENDKQKLNGEVKALEELKSNLEAQLKEIKLNKNLADVYENDVMALKNELILKEDENRELKETLCMLENKTSEMNHYRKSLHKEIENLCNALMENDDGEDNERRKVIYKAAILRSAQALLGLDDNFNFKSDDSGSALDEMKHQIEVYLTEVARIHELVTIKEQQRDELLKEYLDLDDALLRSSSSRHHESHIQGEPTNGGLQSYPNLDSPKPLDLRVDERMSHLKSSSDKLDSSASSVALKMLQDELVGAKSTVSYLLSSCTKLEDSLSKERTEHARCNVELEMSRKAIKELKTQLDMKDNVTKRLNTLIDMMRSKEFNDEITLDQLKSEINWLIDENQKILEKVSATQTELCQCREENSRIQNNLDSVKRQLLSEKYENAKINNQLKHLREQLLNSQTTFND